MACPKSVSLGLMFLLKGLIKIAPQETSFHVVDVDGTFTESFKLVLMLAVAQF